MIEVIYLDLNRALEMYESWQSTYPIVFEYLTGDDAATTESIYQYIQETLSPIRNVVQQGNVYVTQSEIQKI